MSTKCKINGEEVEVSYESHRGEKEYRDCPGSPAYIEITEVIYKSVEVSRILDQCTIDDLTAQCEKDACESAASDAADRAEYRRECARDDAMEREWAGIDIGNK